MVCSIFNLVYAVSGRGVLDSFAHENNLLFPLIPTAAHSFFFVSSSPLTLARRGGQSRMNDCDLLAPPGPKTPVLSRTITWSGTLNRGTMERRRGGTGMWERGHGKASRTAQLWPSFVAGLASCSSCSLRKSATTEAQLLVKLLGVVRRSEKTKAWLATGGDTLLLLLHGSSCWWRTIKGLPAFHIKAREVMLQISKELKWCRRMCSLTS